MNITMFILGLGLRLSPVLNIIHELMHYGFCNIEGIEVISMTWSKITYARRSILVTYGGYYGEFVLYGILTLVFLGRKRTIASFFLGILIVSWLTSFISYDFHKYAMEIYQDQSAVTWSLIRWGILTGLCMIGLLKAYFKAENK